MKFLRVATALPLPALHVALQRDRFAWHSNTIPTQPSPLRQAQDRLEGEGLSAARRQILLVMCSSRRSGFQNMWRSMPRRERILLAISSIEVWVVFSTGM